MKRNLRHIMALTIVCALGLPLGVQAATGAEALAMLATRVDKPRYFVNLSALLNQQQIDISQSIPATVVTKVQSIQKPATGGTMRDVDKETLKEVLQRIADEIPVIKGMVAGISRAYFLVGPQPLGKDPLAVFGLDDPEKQHSKDDLHRLAHWFLTTQPEAGFKKALAGSPNVAANLVKALPAP
jgi:hypothetical protein